MRTFENRFSHDIDPVDVLSLPHAMIHPIIINDKLFDVFDWFEAPIVPGADPEPRHARDLKLIENGVNHLAPGEVFFRCDQTLAFDTPFELKGDGRKFVIIASDSGNHVAKPY